MDGIDVIIGLVVVYIAKFLPRRWHVEARICEGSPHYRHQIVSTAVPGKQSPICSFPSDFHQFGGTVRLNFASSLPPLNSRNMDPQPPFSSGQSLELAHRPNPDVSSQPSTPGTRPATPILQKHLLSLPAETLLQIISYLPYIDRFQLKISGSHQLVSVLRLAPKPSFREYIRGFEKSEEAKAKLSGIESWARRISHDDKMRALSLACSLGHDALIIKIVKEELLRYKRMKQVLHKILEHAVISCPPATVGLLLDLGAKNIDSPHRASDNYGCYQDDTNAIEFAGQRGDVQIIQLLLDAGVSVRFRPSIGPSAIDMAAQNGHLDAVKILIKSIQPIETRKISPALIKAAYNGHTVVAEYLMKCGVEVTPIVNSPTALHVAAKEGHLQCLRSMFDLGAKDSLVSFYDPKSQVSCSDWSTLQFAASNGHAEVVNYLLDKKCLASSEESTQALVPIATRSGSLEVVKLLLEGGFDLGGKFEGETALDFAVASNFLDIISLLLENGAGSQLSSAGQSKNTLLHKAATKGFSQAASLLLAYNPDLNVRDFDGNTPLHLAVLKDHHELAAVLLKAGANPEILNKARKTALNIAVCENFESSVSVLLLGEASTKLTALTKDSILHTALFFGRPAIVALLIAHGADIDAVDAFGRQPIIAASICGNVDCVKLLRDAGANMHAVSDAGKSALHFAVEMGNLEVAKVLVECGLGMDVVDKMEKRPLDYVPSGEFAELRKWLGEHAYH